MDLTVEVFEPEIAAAMESFTRYVVCLEKPPDQFVASVRSLTQKALKAYMDRAPSLRHGIAIDRQVTVIISQTETERPLCGIYFNLFSPYRKALETEHSG